MMFLMKSIENYRFTQFSFKIKKNETYNENNRKFNHNNFSKLKSVSIIPVITTIFNSKSAKTENKIIT